MKNFSKHLIIIFCAQSASLFGISISSLAQEPEIQSAKRLLDLEQPGKAIELMKKSVNTHPSESSLYYYLGYTQMQAGENDQAEQSFEKGISVNPDEPLNYAGKGHFYLHKNSLTDAQSLLDKAMRLSKSKNVAVLQAVARAYMDQPDHVKDALTLLERAKQIDKTNPETYLLIGDARLLLENGGPALSNYEWAANYDSRNAKPHYKIGLVYLMTHQDPIAEESFKKAISLDPQYTLAYKELGEISYRKKDGPAAVNYYQTYLSLTETPEKGQLRYAFFLLMAKDFSKANEVFGDVLERTDASPVALRYYAYSLFESGDYLESRKRFEQYFSKVNSTGTDASDYAHYGKVLIKLNEDSLALISLQKSLAVDNQQPQLLQLLAETYYRRKKYPEAVQSYKQFIKRGQAMSSQDYYSMGLASYFNKRFEEADSAFQKLAEMQPNMTVGYLWSARAKSNLDPESEKGLAKPYYEKFIEKALPNMEKNRNDLIEAYSYLGYYHYLKKEMKVSKSYWNKVLQLDPADVKAKEALKAIR